MRLTIPGKERWLKLQKPQKIPVKKRIISEDLLADVGELPAKAPVAPADAKAAAQPVSKPAPAAAEKGKGGGESKNGASHKPKEGGGKQQLKEGKEPQGGAGPNKPAAQKGGDTSKTKP